MIQLSIHPVFVFDGPNKPPFKRNKRTGPTVASIPEFLAKQLLKQFGFPIHLAPGEAEAECALLQREGIVDAVLSEDVDTMMFGSGMTIRNWSPEQKSAKTPTHVNVYDAVKTKNGASGLDRKGMILIALMSGGDYVPEGIPGCGPKTACEAARAGFGRDLCKIRKGDTKAMQEWRERLQHELKTNESKLFKRKHGTLVIPEDFPRTDILGYYTHPAVSSQAGLDKLRRSIKWDQDLDLKGLREFTLEAFGWAKLEDAKHFIRSLAPSLLVRRLRLRSEVIEKLPVHDLRVIQEDEALLVKGLHGKRQHAITDNSTEIRVSFTPIDLVKIDLDAEAPDTEAEVGDLNLNDDDDELEAALEVDDEGDDEGAPKKRAPTKFDPCKPMRVWVLESIVKVGVPLKVQDWEASLNKPKKIAAAKETNAGAPKPRGARRAKATGDTPGKQPSIASFAKVTKPGVKKSSAMAKLNALSLDSSSASQGAPHAQNDVISLLSSSPIRSLYQAPPRPSKEKSLSPLPEELPPSVTKRRRRAPVQRSHTLPTDTSTLLQRPGTPTRLESLEMLDLVSSPALPSPAQLPAKKARTRTTQNQPVARAARPAFVLSSPGNPQQTTLDAWARSPARTPTKSRRSTPPTDCSSIAPPQLQPLTSRRVPETLDLTLSSPPRSPPAAQFGQLTQTTNGRRTAAAVSRPRPPLQSISPNSSQSTLITKPSSRSSSPVPTTTDINCTAKPARKARKARIIAEPRRTSPRLPKSQPANIESLDLTNCSSPSCSPTQVPSLPEPATSSSKIRPPRRPSPPDSIPISPPPIRTQTQASPSSPSTSTLRRSPRTSTSTSTSPPAAWKTREKKKREIVLRNSLSGSWDFVDVESPKAVSGVVLKGKARRRWRESEIEVLDLS
jgi:Holliday junction resolvase YEN1